jgi:hypothetical protein
MASTRKQLRPVVHASPVWIGVVMAAAGLMVAASPANAQRARDRQTPPPQQTTPAQQDPADSKTDQSADPEEQAQDTPAVVLKPTPFIATKNLKPWTLRTEVVIRQYRDEVREGENRELTIIPMDFTSATMLFPLLPTTSSHRVLTRRVDGKEILDFTGEVTLNDRPVPQDMALIERSIDGALLPANTWRVQWLVANPDRSAFQGVGEINLRFEIPVESTETVFDEAKARAVPWPAEEWPEQALAALQPEAYIEFDPAKRGNNTYTTREIDDLLTLWLEGRDPKQLTPVVLAKWIAGKLAEHVQTSGEGLAYDRRTSLFTGFDLQAPPITAATGRGSPFDSTNLLVAMYRRVGLPARVVIGYDVGAAKGGKTFYDRGGGDPDLRAWAEFCLYDEKEQTLGWVPVDVVAMRGSSSRMPPNFMDRPTNYFGTHDELDEVIPLAHHYAPAQTSAWFYTYPAFWGWFVQPRAPIAGSQFIRFDAVRTARRSNQ